MKFPMPLIAASMALLAGCGGEAPAGNSGVTVEEAQALDDTANMLDASADSLVASEDAHLGNGEAPMPGNATAE